MSIRPLVVAALAATLHGLLAASLSAQEPLPGTPMVDPPVSHPALLAQPSNRSANDSGGGGGGGVGPAPGGGPAAPDATQGKQREGKDLKKAVAAVARLHWHERLGDARAIAAASGKPILFLQALGDLEGFA